ncbi:hypothetical protein PoB_004784000 [Plakobranchus ocellatus]|uniref:Secreted protein n=1 Tax=Plakobranchus ocellatus TaxID=259542 RepID=A0AAV4BPE6_9GAST|nr:hypothetical protein PoB_004784000 [Plakobranchus ocellatus]
MYTLVGWSGCTNNLTQTLLFLWKRMVQWLVRLVPLSGKAVGANECAGSNPTRTCINKASHPMTSHGDIGEFGATSVDTARQRLVLEPYRESHTPNKRCVQKLRGPGGFLAKVIVT